MKGPALPWEPLPPAGNSLGSTAYEAASAHTDQVEDRREAAREGRS